MTMHQLSDIIVSYIENNKTKYDIPYNETFIALEGLLDGLKDEYEEQGLI